MQYVGGKTKPQKECDEYHIIRVTFIRNTMNCKQISMCSWHRRGRPRPRDVNATIPITIARKRSNLVIGATFLYLCADENAGAEKRRTTSGETVERRPCKAGRLPQTFQHGRDRRKRECLRN